MNIFAYSILSDTKYQTPFFFISTSSLKTLLLVDDDAVELSFSVAAVLLGERASRAACYAVSTTGTRSSALAANWKVGVAAVLATTLRINRWTGKSNDEHHGQSNQRNLHF